MSEARLCVGKIDGAHGVRGLVKLRSFTDDPEAIFDYKQVTDESGARSFRLHFKSVNKTHFVVAIDGLDTREGAEALKGALLYIEHKDLKKLNRDEYYVADLVGLPVTDGAGKDYGQIIDYHNYGAGPMLEIGHDRKTSFMVPFNDDYVPVLDVVAKKVVIALPEGWP